MSRTTIVETSDPDSRAVLAYRVGQLEDAVTHGLEKLDKKLDSMAHNFASKADLEAVEKQATAERKNLWKEIESVRGEVKGVKRWLNWGTKTVLGAVLIAILSLVMLTNVVHH